MTLFLHAGGLFSALGNAAFLSVLGAGAFFGYYTWRYTSDELEHMLDEQTKPQNHFPGSQQVSNAESHHIERELTPREVSRTVDASQ